MTPGKTIVLTRWTFIGKVMSLLFIMLSTLAITFLPRSKPFLISWLQSPSPVILEPPKIKSVTVSTVSPMQYTIHGRHFREIPWFFRNKTDKYSEMKMILELVLHQRLK